MCCIQYQGKRNEIERYGRVQSPAQPDGDWQDELLAPDHASGQLDRLEAHIERLGEFPEKFRRYEKEPWNGRGISGLLYLGGILGQEHTALPHGKRWRDTSWLECFVAICIRILEQIMYNEKITEKFSKELMKNILYRT